MCYSPDGHRLAGGWSTEVKVWDADTGQEVQTLRGHEFAVQAVVFHPDGKQLATGSQDWTVRIWDLATGRAVRISPRENTGGFVEALAYSPDGKRLAGCTDNEIRVWDAQTGRQLLALGQNTGGFRGVAYSPNGKRLAAGVFGDHTIQVWNADTGKELLRLKGHRNLITSLAFQPGKQLASSSWDQDRSALGPRDR